MIPSKAPPKINCETSSILCTFSDSFLFQGLPETVTKLLEYKLYKSIFHLRSIFELINNKLGDYLVNFCLALLALSGLLSHNSPPFAISASPLSLPPPPTVSLSSNIVTVKEPGRCGGPKGEHEGTDWKEDDYIKSSWCICSVITTHVVSAVF